MKLKNEDEILDIGFRQRVIAEIKGEENIKRKRDSLKRHDVYKDNTKFWVLEALAKQFEPATVAEMEDRAANISIARSAVDKLAGTYRAGVVRTADDQKSTESIQQLTKEMDYDTKQKKVDKYFELHKNTLSGTIPKKNSRLSDKAAKDLFDIEKRILNPFEYDVIEDFTSPEIPRVVILTDFVERNRGHHHDHIEGSHGVRGAEINLHSKGNKREEVIADSPADEGMQHREFIWWSDKYHFTTDESGSVIVEKSGDELLNPIGMLPWVNYADDQAGSFWAQGGENILDGAILINMLLTDMYTIANYQGWGVPFISGKNVPKSLKIGPHRALVVQQEDKDDPAPNFEYVSSNPPLGDWMEMVKQHVIMYLDSLGLKTSNIGKADGTNPNGISQIIEEAQLTRDTEDKQRMYQDTEPVDWEIIRRWHELLHGRQALTPAFQVIDTFKDSEVKLKFVEMKPVITEEQKLNAIKMRKEIGLNTMLELMMMDNPDLNEDEAKKKVELVKQEKMERMQSMLSQGGQDGSVQPGGEEKAKANPFEPKKDKEEKEEE